MCGWDWTGKSEKWEKEVKGWESRGLQKRKRRAKKEKVGEGGREERMMKREERERRREKELRGEKERERERERKKANVRTALKRESQQLSRRGETHQSAPCPAAQQAKQDRHVNFPRTS